MKCRFCETELNENDKYCPHCGMKVESRINLESNANIYDTTIEKKPRNYNVLVWVGLLAVVFILATYKFAFASNTSIKEDDYYSSWNETPEKYDYKKLNGDFIVEHDNDVVVSNLHNGGYVCDDGTSIYGVNDNGNIVKFDSSMVKNEEIYEGFCSQLQISNGFLYFKDYYKNNATYRMNLTTKEVTLVINEDAYYTKVVGDKVYYQSDSDNESIYQYDLITNESKKINDEASYNIQVVGDLLYYSTSSAIKSYNLTTEETKVIKEVVAIDMICRENDIFYTDSKSTSIYSIDLTDENYKTNRLNRESSSNLIVSGDQIYYLDSSDQVINMKTDGLDNQVVSYEQIGSSLQLQGEYLLLEDSSYYSNYEWYRMDLNGENGEYVYSGNVGSYI